MKRSGYGIKTELTGIRNQIGFNNLVNVKNSMNLLGKQLSAYSFLVIFLIMVIGLIQGKKMLSMFNIGVS